MRIGIMASIGEGNLGDELILEANLQELRRAFSGRALEIDVYSNDVAETKERYVGVRVLPFVPVGLRSFFKCLFNGSLFRIFWALLKTEQVIVGGGGIFYSKEMNVGMNPIFVWWLRMQLVRLFGVKIHLVSVGIEQIEGNLNKWLMREICKIADSVSVRDRGSVKALRALGVGPEIDIWIMHDVVFDLDWYINQKESKKIGLIVRQWGEAGDLFWREVGRKLEEMGYELIWIAMSVRQPDDRKFIKEIGGRLWGGDFNKNGLQNLLAELGLIISVRLHGQITALKSGKRLLAVKYGNKTKSLVERFGVESVNIEDVTTEELIEKVKKVWQKDPVELKLPLLRHAEYYQRLFCD